MCFAEWYYNIPWLTARVAPSTLGAMQEQWINGWDSVQAVNGDCYIHMYTQNKGCGSLCFCNHQMSSQKLGTENQHCSGILHCTTLSCFS